MLTAAVFAQDAIAIDNSPGPHICWIDRVQAQGDGVRVLFTEGAPAGSTSQGRFSVEHNHIVWLSGSKQHQTQRGLLLIKTNKAYLEQSPEDFCEIVYMEVDGRAGIAAHASLNLPAIPHSDRMLFIPAM